MNSRVIGVVALGLFHAGSLAAQGDSTRAHLLDPLIVTAERARTPLSLSTSSVTRISDTALALAPGPTLASALQRVPGFAVLNFDGAGFDPELAVRGFYGGGEAEYVVVQVDGKPVNQLQTGLVSWDALPPVSAIQRVEVVRGSESALYGDAALGAVINVITRRPAPGAFRWSAALGAFGSWRGDIGSAIRIGRREITGSVGVDHSDGFRAHANRNALRAQIEAPLVSTKTTTIGIGWRAFVRAFDEPGPLLASLLAKDRAASAPLFRFDHTHDVSNAVSIDGDRRIGATAHLSTSVTGELRKTNAVKTLALAPGFGDTQRRLTDNQRLGAVVQLDLDRSRLPGRGRLLLGAEIGSGWLDSRYYAVASGSSDDYYSTKSSGGELDARGNGTRTTAAFFGQYAVMITPAIRLSLGSRFDWLRDTFSPRVPDSANRAAASHHAVSPKVGLNVRYHQGGSGSGHIYLTAGRSFKAPTLDQLFDQRPIPVPFPPYAVTTSNPQLKPQSGTNVEAGLYQDGELSRALRASASVSVYQMDMKDELDFDVQSLRYINIGSSRHRGVEAGLTLTGPGSASAFVNYTVQAVESRIGDNVGKQLKAIPRHTMSGGVTVSPFQHLVTTASITAMSGAWLDDANTVALPTYTRVDARAAYPIGAMHVVIEVRNVFDVRGNVTGYLDPAGSGEAYFRPGAGRTLSIGMRGGW